jgi:hypothetical protein
VVDAMNYHSLLDRAGPNSLGPNHPTESQPGFAVAALNATAGYVSPTAAMLSLLAGWLGGGGSEPSHVTVEPLQLPQNPPTMATNLAAAGLGPDVVPCIQAVAICESPRARFASSASPPPAPRSLPPSSSPSLPSVNMIVAINRCMRAVPFLPNQHVPVCGAAAAWPHGWSSVRVYNASVAVAGVEWGQLVGPSPTRVLNYTTFPAGGASGSPIELRPHALSVIGIAGSSHSSSNIPPA